MNDDTAYLEKKRGVARASCMKFVFRRGEEDDPDRQKENLTKEKTLKKLNKKKRRSNRNKGKQGKKVDQNES